MTSESAASTTTSSTISPDRSPDTTTDRPADAPDAIDAAVLADVEAALADLAGLDLDLADPADLDRARRHLPTEPRRAELLQYVLPPALADAIEYVHPSARQAGYWRTSPERSDPRELSPAELRHRIAFIESRQAHAGADGTVELADGRRVPRSAMQTGADLRGESFGDPDDPPTETERARGATLLSRLKSSLGL